MILTDEFIKEMATRRGITQKQAKIEMTDVFETLKECVEEFGGIKLTGYGIFEQKLIKGREGFVNGKEFTSKDRINVKFTPYQKLKDIEDKTK